MKMIAICLLIASSSIQANAQTGRVLKNYLCGSNDLPLQMVEGASGAIEIYFKNKRSSVSELGLEMETYNTRIHIQTTNGNLVCNPYSGQR